MTEFIDLLQAAKTLLLRVQYKEASPSDLASLTETDTQAILKVVLPTLIHALSEDAYGGRLPARPGLHREPGRQRAPGRPHRHPAAL